MFSVKFLFDSLSSCCERTNWAHVSMCAEQHTGAVCLSWVLFRCYITLLQSVWIRSSTVRGPFRIRCVLFWKAAHTQDFCWHELNAAGASHLVQQVFGLLSGQQAEPGCGLQDHRGEGPHGGGHAGLGHLQQLLDACCTLDRPEETERTGHADWDWSDGCNMPTATLSSVWNRSAWCGSGRESSCTFSGSSAYADSPGLMALNVSWASLGASAGIMTHLKTTD